MTQRPTLHIVDSNSRSRAEQARLGFELGYHSEIYADIAELKLSLPSHGIVLVHDAEDSGLLADVITTLSLAGIWLPVVAMSENAPPSRVVDAIKQGALDYLSLPLTSETLKETISRIDEEAAAHGEARRKMVKARSSIESLSPREREVLDWLSQGNSNKTIARELNISPRTVEVHRASMMNKLGASHAAEAVRLRLEAHIDGKKTAGFA